MKIMPQAVGRFEIANARMAWNSWKLSRERQSNMRFKRMAQNCWWDECEKLLAQIESA